MADELSMKAVAKVFQFATYESSDASIELEGIIECTDLADDMVELAFDLRPQRKRTYIRMNRGDLLRMIRADKERK